MGIKKCGEKNNMLYVYGTYIHTYTIYIYICIKSVRNVLREIIWQGLKISLCLHINAYVCVCVCVCENMYVYIVFVYNAGEQRIHDIVNFASRTYDFKTRARTKHSRGALHFFILI